MKLDVEDVDFFPAGAATLTGLSVKDGALKAQYVGQTLDTSAITLEYDYSDGSKTDVDAADVTYKYADANSISDATSGDLKDIPSPLTADMNEKYIYAIAKGKIALVGQLSVSAVSVSNITIKDGSTFGTTVGSYYTTTAIENLLTRVENPETLTATITYNDGTSKDVAYADFATKNLALYKVANGKLEEVSGSDTFAEGTNIFYVAQVSDSGKDPAVVSAKDEITIENVVKDTLAIVKVENANLKYTIDTTGTHTIDFKNADITTYALSAGAGSATQQKVSAIEDKLIFYYGEENAAYDAAKVITNGTTEYTANLTGKYVYVVPADNTSATPVLVGVLADRTIDTDKSATVSNVPTNATYGDKFGEAVTVLVTYDNGDTKTLTYAELAEEGVTMKINVDGTEITVDKDKVLTPDMTGKTVDFYVNGIKVTSSVALTVNKKPVNVILTSPTIPEKEYDGTKDVEEADATTLGVVINTGDLESADSALLGKIGVTGLTFTYADKNVGTDKVINYAGTAAAVKIGDGADADVTTFNSKYTLVLGPSFDNGALKSPKGTITAKTLNVTAITGVPTVEVGAETLTGSGTLALATTNSDIIAGENVTLTYDYAYANADAAGTVKVGITNGAISGADAANYTLGTVPAEVDGEVTNKKLASVTVVAPTKTEYTYPDTKLDLTGMKINLNYEGASAPTEMSVADFIADGGIISFTDVTGQTVTVTADNITSVATLPYGETTITITYGGKEATQKVTAAKKKVSLADITFDASKVYGNDTVTGTYTLADGVIVAGDVVTVEATYTFTEDPETAGENKEVKVTDIKLVGDAAANYELDGTETTINTGIISQGEQVAPAAPTVTVDPNTNNITITGPIGENIEYSIDGGKTWVTDTTFTGLGNDKTVTVQARVKATADGNLAASDASTAEAKTLKYHVVVYQAKSSTGKILKEIYTDDISKPTKDSEVNTMIFDKKPSGFKAYFSDAEAKVAQTYPLTADGNGEVVLYMTKSTGGGGGSGSSTYKVTFSAGTKGEITDGKAIANVTSKVTAVPTVTAKEGYEFIGWTTDGTTVVDPLTVTITKATIFTALYESAVEETPAPTVEPTQEPVDNEPIIDVNYTAPYASGYEDGTFRPENNITRAELAAMIARLSYGGDLPDGMYDSSFPDVADDAWYNKYIAYLEDKNVLSGYEDGTFRPTNTITRGEISAVIARAQRYEILPYSGMFADVTDYDWAKDYIETLATKNIVTGYEDGTFGPYSPLTRAEAVAIINRVLAPSTPVVTFTPNDIAGHWAEADIILAVNERIVNGTEPVEPEVTEAPAEEVTEEVAEETTEATEEVTENTGDATEVAPEGVEGTEITTETEETTEVPAE